MNSLNAIGTFMSFAVMLATAIGGLIGLRARRTSVKNNKHREIEEKMVQATYWIYQVRMWAASHGFNPDADLPELPEILRIDYVKAKAEEEPEHGAYTSLLKQLQQVQKQIDGKTSKDRDED